MGDSSEIRRLRHAADLRALAAHCRETDSVWRGTLEWGDLVLVRTRNSLYTLRVLNEGLFAVSGGWFDRDDRGSTVTRVIGCSWGGRAIHQEVIAAPGLFLELGNGVRTTRIQAVEHRRAPDLGAPN